MFIIPRTILAPPVLGRRRVDKPDLAPTPEPAPPPTTRRWNNTYAPPYSASSGIKWTKIALSRATTPKSTLSAWGHAPRSGLAANVKWSYYIDNAGSENLLLVMAPGEKYLDNAIIIRRVPNRLHIRGLDIRMEKAWEFGPDADSSYHLSLQGNGIITVTDRGGGGTGYSCGITANTSIVIEGCRVDMSSPNPARVTSAMAGKSCVQDCFQFGSNYAGHNTCDIYILNSAFLRVGGSNKHHGEVIATQHNRARHLKVENFFATYGFSAASAWMYEGRPNYLSVAMRRASFIGYSSGLPYESRNDDFSFATNGVKHISFDDVYHVWGKVGTPWPTKVSLPGLRGTSPHTQDQIAPDNQIGANYVSPWNIGA